MRRPVALGATSKYVTSVQIDTATGLITVTYTLPRSVPARHSDR